MERYRQEMMRLYGKSTSKNDTVPANASEAPREKNDNPAPEEKEEKIIPESFHDAREANQEIPPIKNPEPLQTEPEPQKSGIDERYPDPVLDEIMQNPHTKFNEPTAVSIPPIMLTMRRTANAIAQYLTAFCHDVILSQSPRICRLRLHKGYTCCPSNFSAYCSMCRRKWSWS